MMARDSRLDMFYTLKLHTKAHTFVRGRPTLKDVENSLLLHEKPEFTQLCVLFVLVSSLCDDDDDLI